MTGRAPLPLLLIGLGAVLCLAGSAHPAIVAAGAAGAAALLVSAPRPVPRLALVAAALMAAGVFVLTPWISSDGATVLFAGPPLAVIDTTVTAEELLWGAVVAVRLAGVVVAVLAVLAWIDQDRAQDLLARGLPRSALMIGLAGRMVPALEGDAAIVARSARLRGVDLDSGGRLRRARAAAPLVLPLAATALERGVDSSEALVARGFGAPGGTRLPEEPLSRGEWSATACGALLIGLGVATVSGGGTYSYFPEPDGIVAAPAFAIAGLTALMLIMAAAALRRDAG